MVVTIFYDDVVWPGDVYAKFDIPCFYVMHIMC